MSTTKNALNGIFFQRVVVKCLVARCLVAYLVRVKFCVDTQLERVFFSPFFLSWLGSLYSFFAHVCVFLVQCCMILLELACEQALCLGKKK